MDAQGPRGIVRLFDGIEDHRINRTRRYTLQDILTIAPVAILGGADAWTAVELFGRTHEAWFRRFLGLPGGIPSHDTFGRVFARLDPAAMGKCFERWVRHVAERLRMNGHPGVKAIAIDGKTLRGSADAAGGAPAPHLLSAWAHEARLVLAQVAVDSKSNEITAIPELIAMLDLAGCVVTVDALNTQKTVAEAILDRDGDYVMALKGNQGTPHTDATLMLAEADDASASKRFADAVRGHWGIQAAHWVLDVTFNEDRCRSRKDHSDQNLALLRRLAMNLLRQNRDRSKLSMKAQRLRIGWNPTFLEDLLRHLD